MKVLVVKTSSLGDVIHTLPALTDAARAINGVSFDWVVEEGLAEIPAWHPAVGRVIPLALRRWRKRPLDALRSGEWQRYHSALRAECYDAVIDAQGLLKSALLSARLARGQRYGFDRKSAREPLAALLYHHPVHVPKGLHAVERTRVLFAAALGYKLPNSRGEYGIASRFTPSVHPRSLIFIHGTTWQDKHWPEVYWIELAAMAASAGFRVELPWGTEAEHERALRIAASQPQIAVLPRSSLTQLASRIAGTEGVVSVDTGLSHLAAALDRPNVVLFGPTDPALVGGYGRRQVTLRASDLPPVERSVEPQIFAPLTPSIVWTHLKALLDEQAGQEQQDGR